MVVFLRLSRHGLSHLLKLYETMITRIFIAYVYKSDTKVMNKFDKANCMVDIKDSFGKMIFVDDAIIIVLIMYFVILLCKFVVVS